MDFKNQGKVDLWIFKFANTTINLKTNRDPHGAFSLYKMDLRDCLSNGDRGRETVSSNLCFVYTKYCSNITRQNPRTIENQSPD